MFRYNSYITIQYKPYYTLFYFNNMYKVLKLVNKYIINFYFPYPSVKAYAIGIY